MALVVAATTIATAAPSRAACGDQTGVERCAADCPDNQVRDGDSCAAKANQNGEAPLKKAWEDLFGPLPSPSDFALARVDNPVVDVGLPGVGLPGVGLGGVTIALPAAGAGAATGAALPSIGAPAIGLPAPSIPDVGLPALPDLGPPALPGVGLPGPPNLLCQGFGTPIPFVGFSTC
jgi:hypothetical protein